MEEMTHWATMAKCSLCCEIPECAPLFQCPFQHQYCYQCTDELKKRYRGSIKEGSTCVVCKTSGVFVQSKINTDFLNKIKTKPGIGRPYRYNSNNVVCNNFNYNRALVSKARTENDVTVEGLFRLSSEELGRLLNRKTNGYSGDSDIEEVKLHKVFSQSKIPIRCPHKPCGRMVAPSAFVTHFKHEHPNIPKYNVERGKELCLPCDVSIIEHGAHFCLAMITVYEINKIDVKRSKSSQSVIKTCSKFNQQVPVNSFWLMVSGSADRRPDYSYVFYWLFNTSDDPYQNTIELSSKNDSLSFSTFCGVCTSPQEKNFRGVVEHLDCLIVNTKSISALLSEGPEINLRVTVH